MRRSRHLPRGHKAPGYELIKYSCGCQYNIVRRRLAPVEHCPEHQKKIEKRDREFAVGGAIIVAIAIGAHIVVIGIILWNWLMMWIEGSTTK